ncbi:hypothetical protein LCGC14_2438930 [marine sediment metagenome]|uniref:Uncharacterized protein n=1 Tax=marine sediment metagenome TaxID=412755 RepID=A0A0F9DWK0_9ZZZZ
MSEDKIDFTEDAVMKYLDDCIDYWRDKRDKGINPTIAIHYIDIYQSVRTSLFGETKPIANS